MNIFWPILREALRPEIAKKTCDKFDKLKVLSFHYKPRKTFSGKITYTQQN